MLIVCKTCASSYHIPQEILGENGCRLRCVGCGEISAVSAEAMATSGAPIVEGQRLRFNALEAPRRGSGGRLAVPAGDDAVWRQGAASKPALLSAFRRGGTRSPGLRGALAAVAIIACAMAVV